MAIGRRIVTRAEFVLDGDSALAPGTDYQRYIDSLFAWEHLRVAPDSLPTVFVLKPLTHAQRLERDNIQGTLARLAYTFRAGVTEIRGYVVANGNTQTGLEPLQFEETAGGRIISSAWMAQAALPQEHFISVAAAVGAITEAQLPLSRRSGQASGAAALQAPAVEATSNG